MRKHWRQPRAPGAERITTDLVDQLAHGPLYRFADWPNPDVSNWGAGVYTVWDNGGALVYVGTAGRGLNAGAHQTGAELASKRRKGLRDRLGSHASGRLAGDQFSIYVLDRLVLPALSAEQVEAAAAGELSIEALTRRYIHDHLAYRFVITGDDQAARALEREVQRGSIDGRRPLLNPGC